MNLPTWVPVTLGSVAVSLWLSRHKRAAIVTALLALAAVYLGRRPQPDNTGVPVSGRGVGVQPGDFHGGTV